MYTLQFDGATNPNPGPMGVGAVLYDSNGTEVASCCNFVGDGTNNQSEYLAVIAGLKLALSKNVSALNVQGDSKLVINQIDGAWQCSKPELQALLKEVLALKSQFELVSFSWIPRSENARADVLSKEGLAKKSRPSIPVCEKPEFNNVLDLRIDEPEEQYDVIYHSGVGFSVVAAKRLYSVNLNPVECSCGGTQSSWCSHIKAAFDFAKQHRKSA